MMMMEEGLGKLPLLREFMHRSRQDSEGVDTPDLDYRYDDADSHINEIAELYSYTEEPEFQLNRRMYQESMEKFGIPSANSSHRWTSLSDSEKQSVIQRLLDRVELSSRQQRAVAARAVLYLLQGCFGESDCEESQQQMQRANAFLLYESGVFSTFVELLNMEAENGVAATAAIRKPAISLADTSDLRVILSVLYIITEVMRSVTDEDEPRHVALRDAFRTEISQACGSEDLLAITLFGMVTRFCSGAAPHFPIRKVLLMLWKSLLVSLGGMTELKSLKAQYRTRNGLPPAKEDTVDVARGMRAASPPASAADLIEAQQQKRTNRPFRRSLVKQSSMDDSMLGVDSDDAENDRNNQDDDVLLSDPDDRRSLETECDGNTNDDLPIHYDDNNRQPLDHGDIRPNSPRPDTPATSGNVAKGLPWTPKVRQKDIDNFLTHTRMKFVGYPLYDDQTSVAGLPQPIHEGLKVLKHHVYESLAEVQVKKEEKMARNPISQPENDIPQTPTEILYQHMLPNLPQYMIALLKVLLAAAPTSKAKTDSVNIMTDVLPEEMPMTVPQSMKLGIDVNRHKEVIVKAISAILLLLLKHFKINHIYQFEFVSQHLVFANCIPLVLKFFNQNISAYVQAKNSIALIDFPSCVIGEQPELTAETLCSFQEIGDNQQYCWRNMFSCINLLRVLNKLVKWKHSRVMMLVVFKSAPILKRALKVKHATLQLYVLKLLKMQTKYLGRQWRKSNMKTMSAIYQKVRHRLNDDWAYGNDIDARPWDFQAEECSLRAGVDRFNARRYGERAANSQANNATNNINSIINGSNNGGSQSAVPGTIEAEFEPVDNCILSVLGQKVCLTEEFKRNYEIWLYQEVFQAEINWDQLLSPAKI